VYSCKMCHIVNRTSSCRYSLTLYLLVINEICIFVMCASTLIEPVYVVIFLMLFLLVINEMCIKWFVLCARQLMKPVHAFILHVVFIVH